MSTHFGIPSQPLAFTVDTFPSGQNVQERSALPFGIVIDVDQCATKMLGPNAIVAPGDLEQCHRCGAYINSRCRLDYRRWMCSICGEKNARQEDVKPSAFVRKEVGKERDNGVDAYEVVLGARPLLLPALTADATLPVLHVEGPRVVALVDVSGSKAYIDRTRSSLLEAVEKLQVGSLFSLVTFSDTIGVYQLGCTQSTLNVAAHCDR